MHFNKINLSIKVILGIETLVNLAPKYCKSMSSEIVGSILIRQSEQANEIAQFLSCSELSGYDFKNKQTHGYVQITAQRLAF